MDNLDPATIAQLNTKFQAQPVEALLGWTWDRFGSRAAIGTSFQGAGLVTIHIARTHGYLFPIFTLDTGLLFPETIALKKRLEDFFQTPIEALEPDLTVEQQAAANGPELWLRDPDLCCTMRKVLPLQSKLATLEAWITGLRRDQSDTRSTTALIELYDAESVSGKELIKINPLANWPRQKVWDYLKEHKIPYNPLQDQGYRSIGCQPCTVKAGAGENERAGRWTGFNKVECGIHTFMARKA